MRSLRRQILSALVFLPVFAGIYWLAFWLRFEGQLAPIEQQVLTITIGWVVAGKLVVFLAFRVFLGWNRYVTFHDLLTLARASSVASLIIILVDFLAMPWIQIPRSVFLIDWGTTIVVVGGLRSLSRLMEEFRLSRVTSAGKTPVFIVGVNDAGDAILRVLRRSRKLSYRVVGFISHSPKNLGSRVGGVPVIGLLEDTCKLAAKCGVTEVLIAAGELTGKLVRQLVEDGRRHDVKVTVLPGYEQLLDGRIDVRPRTVSISDLLRRDAVQLDLRELHQWIDNQVLLVTGSSGSIGSEICRQLLNFAPRKMVLVDRSENGQFHLERELQSSMSKTDVEICMADVTDAARMDSIFRTCQPDIVIHAAAYKHVPLMETNVGEAVKNVSLATRMLADLAHRSACKSFVMVSTDKAVNPTSVMGVCKRVAELYVQALADKSSCRFVTVRFGNVLDSSGSVVPIFREQISQGGPVTVTHPEMTRYFMTIPEASQLVIQAGAMGRGGEIFVLNMGAPVRILDLARDMIRLSGLHVGEDMEIKFVGTRQGEKLFEELHAVGETHVATTHPKILVAECHRVPRDALQEALAELAVMTEGPQELIIDRLRRIVPEFAPAGQQRSTNRRRAA